MAVEIARPGRQLPRPSKRAGYLANRVPGPMATRALDWHSPPAQRLTTTAGGARPAGVVSACQNRKSQGVKAPLSVSSAPVLSDVVTGELRFSKVFEGLGVLVIRQYAFLMLDGLGIQESTRTRNHGKPYGDIGEQTRG